MSKFLSIRFIGYPNVASIINFCKKSSIVNICCLAIFSLLLVAFRAEAMPQKVSKNDIFSSLSKTTSSRWAVPSSSCSSRPACNADTNFQQEFNSFVNFIHLRYPSAQVPSAEQLQRHACKKLTPGEDSRSADDSDVSKGQWLATFLSYSFWTTQAGTDPYQTAPVWWCFLDDSSRYVVTDTIEYDGPANIIPNFAGLGQPKPAGSGFYVSQATVTDAYPAISLEPEFFAAQTYTNKELVNINLGLSGAGTTKRLGQYQSLMKIRKNGKIALIQETVNTLKTIEWLNLCTIPGVGCTNCPSGTLCP